MLGATYVDRINTNVLPVAGFIYTPNDDAEYKLVFPGCRRFPGGCRGPTCPASTNAGCTSAANSAAAQWAVERTTAPPIELDVTDWRVFIGLERKIVGGLSRRVELGYVFARKLEYQSDRRRDRPERHADGAGGIDVLMR